MRYCKHWQDIRKDIESGSYPLIDLRSPKEFQQGHIPRAINIPLLNNEERHEIGKLYKEAGKNEAVSRGLEIFANKSDAFMSSIEAIAPHKKLALHCWRGGMRSRLVAYWLSLAGFDVMVLEGGYKNFRKDVLNALERLARHSKIVLNGRTGSGKTEFIEDLMKNNCPAINLEGLAHHRGSAFGGIGQDHRSPTQQNFENTLYDAYLNVESAPCILMEIENFIGPVSVPQRIRESLQNSPMVFLSRDFDDRVQILTDIYCKGWNKESEREFISQIVLLRKYISHVEEVSIIQAIRRKDFSFAISQLLRLRYDRVYDKSLRRHEQQAIAHFNLTSEENAAKDFVQKALTDRYRS